MEAPTERAAPGAVTVDTTGSVHSGSAVNADPLEEDAWRRR